MCCPLQIQRDKETFFPLGPCPEPHTLPGSCTPPAPVTGKTHGHAEVQSSQCRCSGPTPSVSGGLDLELLIPRRGIGAEYRAILSTANISQNKVNAKIEGWFWIGLFYGNNNHHIFAFKQRGCYVTDKTRSHFPEPRSFAVLPYSPVALMYFHGTANHSQQSGVGRWVKVQTHQPHNEKYHHS